MRQLHAISVGLIASAGIPSVGAGQYRDSLAVSAGARVRVVATSRPPGKLSGKYVRAGADSVYVVERGRRDTSAVSWDRVREIYVGGRRYSRTEAFHRGARVGAIVTGVISVAAVAAAITNDVRGKCGDCGDVPVSAVIIPVSALFTVSGTMVGGVLGLPFAYRWQRVWPTGTHRATSSGTGPSDTTR